MGWKHEMDLFAADINEMLAIANELPDIQDLAVRNARLEEGKELAGKMHSWFTRQQAQSPQAVQRRTLRRSVNRQAPGAN